MAEEKVLSRKEVLEIIKEIKDPEVKDFIFNGEQDDDDFLSQKDTMYKYFSNILILSFMFLYGKFLKWKTSGKGGDITDPRLRASSNFMRIITTLDKLYYEFNLTYELIENLLSDIQILLVTENCPVFTNELGIENCFSSTTKFSHFTHIARIGRYGTGRTAELDDASLGERRMDLVEFLKMIPFIKDLDINSKSSEEFEKGSIDEQLLPFVRLSVTSSSAFNKDEFEPNFSFLTNDSGEFYYLESLVNRHDQTNKTDYLVLTYVKIGTFAGEIQSIYFIIKNVGDEVDCEIEGAKSLEDINGVEGFKRKLFPNITSLSNDHFIKDFNSINFRYVRVLSLAISDILNEEDRAFIYNTYGKKAEFRAMFNKEGKPGDYLSNHNSEESGYGWDVVIATLLIEESANKLLSELFKNRESKFDQLLVNLNYRFGKDIDPIALRQRVTNFLIEEKDELKKRNGDKDLIAFTPGQIEEEKKITAKIQAQVIINRLSELTESNKNEDFSTRFPLSMRSRIRIINEIATSDSNYVDGYSEKVKTLKYIVTQTLKTLYLFYKGLLGYASEKYKFERESALKPLDFSDIANSQRRANEYFDKELKKAKKVIDTIESDDVSSVVKKIKEFCVECSSTVAKNSYNELLKKMVGRNFLLDYNEIAILEDCFDNPVETARDLRNLTGDIEDVFDYLMTGVHSVTKISDGTIFPSVAYLDYISRTRDGYNIMHFSTTIDSDKERDIKVISEYIYQQNKSYYCVPNKARSNDELHLWIEPLVINYEHLTKEDSGDEDEEEEIEVN